MSNQVRAVILARVSSKSQEDEGYSLDSQLKLLKGYCDKEGLEVVRVFRIAETASKQQSRKIFQEMLDYLYEAKVYHLTVEKTDRFTRNLRDAVAIDDWLEQDQDRRLHSVKENLLLHKHAKSDVKFMWNIHLSVAKKFADNLREEAMKGWAEKLAQGWLPGRPPAGYMTITRNGKKVHIPDRTTSKLVLKLFKNYLKPGESIDSTLAYSQKIGLKSMQGRMYTSKAQIHKILENPFYIGINRFNGNDYPGLQETFIPKTIYDQVQHKLHHKRPRTFKKHFLSLQGVIKCVNCGSLITWQLQKGNYYGVCRRLTAECKLSKMLREDKIEDLLISELRQLVSPNQAVIEWVANKMRKHHKTQIEERETAISQLKTRISRIKNMDEMLYDDKLAGEISKERYEDKHATFKAERAKLEEQIAGFDSNNDLRLEQALVILQLSQKAAEIYPKKSPEEKRLIISKLFHEVTLDKGVVSVKYTKFAEAIADKVLKTRALMEG